LSNGEAAPGGETAKRIRNPRREHRNIVEREHVAIAGGNEEVANFAR
jgi:hypothetical protein